MDKNWKAVERRIAKKLGGRRIPLSGRNNLGAVGDVRLDGFRIEAKSGLQIPKTVSDWLTILTELEREEGDRGDIAVLVMQPKFARGMVAVLTLDDLARLISFLGTRR